MIYFNKIYYLTNNVSPEIAKTLVQADSMCFDGYTFHICRFIDNTYSFFQSSFNPGTKEDKENTSWYPR